MYNKCMITIDQILLDIVNNTNPTVEEYLLKRDARVLRSLASIILNSTFITENQGRLLLKIIRDNQEKIPFLSEEIKESVASPSWSKIFRQVEIVKKFYITPQPDGDSCLTIEFTFSSPIRKTLQAVSKSVSNLVQISNGKIYTADLTEKNIVALVEALAPYDFVTDEKIQNYYTTIKSWSREEVQKQFLITNIVYPNFQKQITADLGIDTTIDENIIIDRSMRYQYFYENTEKNTGILTDYIASRTSSKLWIDKNKYSVSQVIESLVSLKRFPLLVVFDSYTPKKCLDELTVLSESLKDYGIYDNIGIYFRLDNNDNGKEFNQYIANNSYNCQLDLDTRVVGVQTGKIPKFLLKTDWKPMSVLSLGATLRHSKTAVYASCCDLILTYSDVEPIMETMLKWE
jgi:hypothetical protein